MRLISKLFNLWSIYWLIAGLLLGAIIHLVTILTLPHLSEHKAWDRIGNAYPINAMTILPPISPDAQPLPFMAPDIRYAICRYNVKDKPLVVRTTLLNENWSIAVFDKLGDNVYTVSGANLRSNNVDIKISLAENDKLKFGIRQNQFIDSGIPVKVNAPEGLVMVRAPVLSKAYTDQAITHLRMASCKIAKH